MAQYPSSFSMEKETGTYAYDVKQDIKKNTKFDFPYANPIYGLSVSGALSFNDESNSFVRITIADNYNREYLVYEAYPLITDSLSFSFDDIAMETLVLDGIRIKSVNISISNAALKLDKIEYLSRKSRTSITEKQHRIAEQKDYLIDKINQNLKKTKIPWRAGKTSLSDLSYEEKKAMFGDSVPYLGGLEYYVGGFFVSPHYKQEAEPQNANQFVSEWDWRNRHGKNWVTPIRNQGTCGSCWVFSVVAAVESYVNLYYNKIIDMDLSEQNVVSCSDNNSCDGGILSTAWNYIKQHGISEEDCYPYIYQQGDCSSLCSDPQERLFIDEYKHFSLSNKSEEELKQALFKAPIAVAIPCWRHAATIIGFKRIEAGDSVFVATSTPDYEEWFTIDPESPLVGKTAWLMKDSKGIQWGDQGFFYLVTNLKDFSQIYTIEGGLTSLQYSSDDIVVEDADQDGYYWWGVGDKPDFLPENSIQDGDDSNPFYGPIDEFGNLIPNDSIKITGTTIWKTPFSLNRHVHIANGGRLRVNSEIDAFDGTTFIVDDGGELIIDGGKLNHVKIFVRSGGHISLTNEGSVLLGESASFEMEKGASMELQTGSINIIK